MTKTPLYQDADYIQGQIDALRAMILGLAQMQTSLEFREQSLERLETLKTAYLAMPVREQRIQAVDDCIAWVLQVS